MYTLLHTDYLLKEFMNEMEVSACAPFESKSMWEGLAARLPAELQQRLFPWRGTKENSALPSAVRVWLEAAPLSFVVVEEGPICTYNLGPAKMEVKSECLMMYTRNADGSLNLTIGGGVSPWHQSFTSSLTAHYEELGGYFPEFLRLRELNKLCAASLVFQHHYRVLFEKFRAPSLESLRGVMKTNDLRGQVLANCGGDWPLTSAAR